jgi:membrane protein DedA with SNARE-associated domain
VNEWLDWILSAVQSVDPLLRSVIAGLAILAETSLFVGLIIPGDTVVLVASSGVQTGDVFGFLSLLGFVLLGSLIGESLGFWLGRLFGERIRASRLGKRIGESNWKMADSFIDARGGLAVAISRFLPVLHSLVPVTAGMSRMAYRKFISWTFGACLVWSTAYVGVGAIAHNAYEQFAGKLKWAGVIFVAIIVVFVIVAHFGKQRLEAKAAAMIAQAEAEAPKLDSTQERSAEMPVTPPTASEL